MPYDLPPCAAILIQTLALRPRHDSPPSLPALATLGAAWSAYLPLGVQYSVLLASGGLAVVLLARAQRLAELRCHPLLLLPLLFWLWTALSMLWSVAPQRDIVGHLWHYVLPLWLLPLARTIQPADAQRALRHFIVISTIAALLLPWLLPGRITGNYRIAFSLLLALSAALAVIEALATEPTWRQRAPWLVAALFCAVGLALQDRRTGMLALPLLLGALAWARQRSWWRRIALVGAVMMAALLVWQFSPTVQSRFAEGISELRAYPPEGEVASSWGMRLRLLEVSAQMFLERPFSGHGVGAWLTLWQQRAPGGALLQAHTTPHSEYLLVAVQGGAVGLLLFVLAVGAFGVAAWRRGRDADAALLVWLAFAFAGLFNVVLRDAKFALPLLMLGAIAWAASRRPSS